MIILAGDVGGTNTRLALFSSENRLGESVHEEVFRSKEYRSLQDVLVKFFTSTDLQPEAAAFVIAGPVFGDEIEVTNLDWVIRKSELRQILADIPLEFYNDMAGIGNFIPVIDKEDLFVLNEGKLVEHRTKVVLAPGTGLGEGFLVWDGNDYLVQPSEGGHVSFAPVNDLQIDLLKFMWRKYEHVSYERVCSGMAIPDLYAFLREREGFVEPDWFKAELEATSDQTPVIVNAAIEPDRKLEICGRALDLFVAILAAEAGNLAVKVLASGGVYLAGGVAQKLLPLLQEKFLASYSFKGRFTEYLTSVPVYVVTHPQPGLFGAAKFAFALAGKRN